MWGFRRDSCNFSASSRAFPVLVVSVLMDRGPWGNMDKSEKRFIVLRLTRVCDNWP